MSYEGYEEHICENGHLFCASAYEGSPVCDCGARSVYMHAIDETNYEPIEMEYKVKEEALFETCPCCGNKKLIRKETYFIPTKADEDAAYERAAKKYGW